MLPSRIIILLFILAACIHFFGRKEKPPAPGFKYGANIPPYQTTYKVIRIKDGDTFVLLAGRQELVVRLAHIDCPEKKQPFSQQAKQFASDICFGKYVTILHQDVYDRNKRLIAEILLDDGRNVNMELVKNGLAWHYKKYSDNAVYAALEITAREEGVGIWSGTEPVAPWLWRKKR